MANPLSPTFDSLQANGPEGEQTDSITVEEISDAAEALREVEMEAARGDFAGDTSAEWNSAPPMEEEYVIPVNLGELSIDELRAVAGMLQIPNYAQITDQEELMAIVRTYAQPAPKPR